MDIPAWYSAAAGFIGTVFGSGVALGSARSKMGAISSRVADLEVDLSVHSVQDAKHHTEQVDRMARLETKIDMVLERLR